MKRCRSDGGGHADQVPKKAIGPSIIAKQMAPSEDVIGVVDNKALTTKHCDGSHSLPRNLVRAWVRGRHRMNQLSFGSPLLGFKQHFLYFFPLPHGQGSLRPIFGPARMMSSSTSSESE
jgi:hypothetical protein